MKIRILYIEDDAVDQKVFLRALKEVDCTVDIAEDFETAYQLNKQHQYDLVVSDQHVGPDDLKDEIKNWKSHNLLILSNQIDKEAFAHYQCYEKPFRREMLSVIPTYLKDELSMLQLESLFGEDTQAKDELVSLIEKELETTKSRLSTCSAKSCSEKSAIIHKVLNKVAILGMRQSRLQLLSYEKQLRQDDPLSEAENQNITTILDTAIDYVKQTRP